MKKTLFALALSLLLAATTTPAFPVGDIFPVEVNGVPMGTITARNIPTDHGAYCGYTLEWSSDVRDGRTRTVTCEIRERKTAADSDCGSNGALWAATVIERNGVCNGFDELGNQTSITDLVLGGTRRGAAGLFYAVSTHDQQVIEINP